MEPATILLFVAAAVASLFMAWVIGIGVGGRRERDFDDACGVFADVLGFAGAVTQDTSVSEAVGTGLVDGDNLPVSGVIVVLLIGAGRARGSRSPTQQCQRSLLPTE